MHDPEMARLRWRCRRGMKELDLLLLRFVDDDYARRSHAKGYRIICAEDVFVHHWGSVSFSKLEDETYRQIFENNRRKLEAKWGIQWIHPKGRYEGIFRFN